MSRSIAAITIGAVIGGGLGLLIGLVFGAGNPFVYMAIGIAVGAGAYLAVRGVADRAEWLKKRPERVGSA